MVVFLIHIEPEISTMLRTGQGIQSTSAQCTTVMLNYIDNDGRQQTVLAHNEDAIVAMPKTIPYMVHTRITTDAESPSIAEEWSAYCYPGHIAGNCFSLNIHGLATTTNRLFPNNVQRGKIPYYIAARALLSCDSIDAAEEMIRTDMHRVALGMSVSLAFSAVADSEQIVANIEIAPTDTNAPYGGKNYHVKRIPVASRKEEGFYFHCNRYDRIPDVAEGEEVSSDHRKRRIEALPVPSSVDDVLAIIGDTAGDERFPVYRSGKEPDYLFTAATGVFDMMASTFSIYTNNPANGPGPVMKIPMAKRTVKKIL
ncbi:beta-alanyl-dopamine/carcinine hydrolase-like isoform X2 [Amphiura filiformis]|uniref:beta-alanyl-dopamine/carcinine hydrolase-like isoform X2 n=1 Tax=Amphiura filiformis TaxID=82378 RepID=UPI003B2279F6